MVAKIVSGKSIRGGLNYNENKVKVGTAGLVMASLFGREADKLSFSDKIRRFAHLTDLNSRVKTNSLHIMLNFSPQGKAGQLQAAAGCNGLYGKDWFRRAALPGLQA